MKQPKKRFPLKTPEEMQSIADKAVYDPSEYHHGGASGFKQGPPPQKRVKFGSITSLCPSSIGRQCAERMLRAGIRAGAISVDCPGGWPKNVYYARNDEANSVAYFRAILSNPGKGTYHGVPISERSFRLGVPRQLYDVQSFEHIACEK